MSGSSGGGYGGGGGSETSCARLTFAAMLSSPKQQVVQMLSVGDALDVVLVAGATATVQVHFRGQVAGGLQHSLVLRLRDCLEQGVAFKAEVLTINNGQVNVRVSAV